nr:DUF2811 domain-containing protein [Prochlorococcus sp. MIT 1341]
MTSREKKMQSSDVSPLTNGLVNEAPLNVCEDSNQQVNEGVVSFQTELPVALQSAMAAFIERYPNWDQYRLIQAALAGFLVQNGAVSRSITRLYVGKMFSCDSLV